MKTLIDFILAKFIATFSSIQEKEAAFYREQIKILLRILQGKGVKRILAEPEEIEQLMALGKQLDHDVDEQILIVKAATYRNWLRRKKRGDEIKRPGRKRSIPEAIVATVIRLIKENPGWGWLRLVGEMKKVGVSIAAATIARICRNNGLPMPPRKSDKRLVSDWSKFVALNMENIVACDYFCKTIYSLKGVAQAYSLVFIHYASRRVFVSPPTLQPDDIWTRQQARNAAMWMEDEGIELRYLIRDRDTKFTGKFDKFFKEIIAENPREGRRKGKVIQTGIRCPPQNGYVETWIGHFKCECLDAFACFSLKQFGRVIAKYSWFHNEYRPHQNKGNRVIGKEFSYPEDFSAERVRCKKILGGLLKHYYLTEEDVSEKEAA